MQVAPDHIKQALVLIGGVGGADADVAARARDDHHRAGIVNREPLARGASC